MVVFPVGLMLLARRAWDDDDEPGYFDPDMSLYKTNSEGKKVLDKGAVAILACFLLCCAGLVDYSYFHNPWENACRKAKKQGVERILNDAHVRAEKSVANSIQCVPVLSVKEARRDSARYAKNISKFVDDNDMRYIRVVGSTPGIFSCSYECDLNNRAVCSNPEVRRNLAGYENAVRQLVAARKSAERNVSTR